MIDALKQRLQAKSTALLLTMESRLDRIIYFWLAFAALASAVRLVASFAPFGSWQSISTGHAWLHPLYGSSGITVSLLVGMLLNVPVRAAEYFAAMPPLTGLVPAWLNVLHTMMTLDVVMFSSLSTI